ncbi:MAG: inner membrane protein [Thermacetogenium sp.]|nr:inner membrane protein [Thermacetogenium sp.]
MLWYTHVMAGAAAGVLLAGSADPKGMLVAAGVSGFASLLPDIDSPASILGRTVPVFSWGTKIVVGHRQVFHSLLAAIAVSYLLSSISVLQPHFWFLFYGYASHLLLDAMNPEGVPLLWPFPIRLSLPLVETGSLLERLVLRPLFAILFCFVLVSRLF